MTKKLIATCAIVFIIAIVSVASILYLFYNRIHDRTSELYHERVAMSTSMNSEIIETKLYSYINVVSTAAETMKNQSNIITDRNLEKIKYIVKNHPDFLRMGICNNDGIVHYTDDNILNISNTKSFNTTKIGNISITDRFPSHLSPDDVFIISVPIIDDNKEFRGHVQATIPVNNFQKGASNFAEYTIFKTSIIDSNLNYILHVDPAGENADKSYRERLNRFHDKVNPDAIMQKLKKREGFSHSFINNNDSTTTIFYVPLDINDWYLLTYLDSSAVDAHIAAVLDKDIYYMVAIIILIILCLGAALAFYYYKVNQIIYSQELNFRNQLLSLTSAYLEINMQTDMINRCSEAVTTQIKCIGNQYTKLFNYYVENNIDKEYRPFVIERLSLKSLQQSYESGIKNISIEYALLLPNGGHSWREASVRFFRDTHNCNIVTAYMVILDINDKKSKELEFKEKAEKDYLTGLYNREKGTELINSYLSTKRTDTCAALLILDVDNFKTLNDTLGHNIGDIALKDVADILIRHFRQYDVVFRLAGDEFIILLKDLPSPTVINKIIKALLYKLNLSYGTDNNNVHVTCSVGITVISPQDKNFNDLYVKADKALYQAKHEGRSAFKIYQET